MDTMGIFLLKEKFPWECWESNPGSDNQQSQPLTTRPRGWSSLLISEKRNVLANQYNETNVMHFSFNLLRIKSLYMFRALVAQPQKAPKDDSQSPRLQFHCNRGTAN
jgi:hypothetical protein